MIEPKDALDAALLPPAIAADAIKFILNRADQVKP